ATFPPRITMTAEPHGERAASAGYTLVLYDGVCGLCNRLVAFLLKHDDRDQFRFAPLQREFARNVLRRHGLNASDFDTVVVVADFGRPTERAFTRSEAALCAIGRVGGIWNAFRLCRLIPFPAREALYQAIARRRYRIFGKYDTCPLPHPENR